MRDTYTLARNFPQDNSATAGCSQWGRRLLSFELFDVLELIGRLVAKEVGELVEDAAYDESGEQHRHEDHPFDFEHAPRPADEPARPSLQTGPAESWNSRRSQSLPYHGSILPPYRSGMSWRERACGRFAVIPLLISLRTAFPSQSTISGFDCGDGQSCSVNASSSALVRPSTCSTVMGDDSIMDMGGMPRANPLRWTARLTRSNNAESCVAKVR